MVLVRMLMAIGEILLTLCGVINALIALLHVLVIYYGAPAYRYFGAGEKMAMMAEQGALFPAVVTSGITIVFAAFAAVAFAEAGWFTLPYSYIALVAISAIYTLRGLMVVPLFVKQGSVSRFDLVSSVISLAVGLMHFAGLFLPLSDS